MLKSINKQICCIPYAEANKSIINQTFTAGFRVEINNKLLSVPRVGFIIRQAMSVSYKHIV
jgi:hypothetical protein